MKKIFKKFSFLISFLIVLGACDDIETININENANTTVSLSTNTLVLSQDIEDDEVLTISWTAPDFGFDAAPLYEVLIDIAGGNFTEPQIIPVGTDLSKLFTAGELNTKLLYLGLEPNETTNVDIKVQTSLSEFQETLSESVSLTVTPFSSILDLSTTWGIVGSAANNWGATPDLPFYTTNQAGVLVAYVTLTDGEIKFRENNDWANNLGDTGNDGTLEQNGDNIAVSAGIYKIVMNLNNLTYTIDPFTLGAVGEFSGWGASPDAPFTYDSTSDQWRLIITLPDGDMKFRLNNDWGTNYGEDNADGILDLNGGNFTMAAGNYIFTINLNDLSYSIEEIPSIWGLVGAAYNNWGATPDAAFTRDWALDDVWVLNGVTLLDGEWKIRANNDWGINYGDDGGDGTLEINGANITSTSAGIYNITLDFSVDPALINIQQ
jgi:hypothetical protein